MRLVTGALLTFVQVLALQARDVLSSHSFASVAFNADDECQIGQFTAIESKGQTDCTLSALQHRGRAGAARTSLAAESAVLQVGRQELHGPIRWTNFPDKCLDVADGRAMNGTRVQLWDCFEDSRSQQFVWSNDDGKIRWASNPSFCVDVHDHNNANGNYLQLWRCIQSNQDQSFVVALSGEAKIRWSAHMDKCIDVKDHGSLNGNVIQIWACSPSNSDQDFSFGGRGVPSSGPPLDGRSTSAAGRSVVGGAAYDVIIVGGGMMGAAVAARLAEKLPPRARLVLLEAGNTSQSVLGGSEPPASWNREAHRWDTWPGTQGLGLTKYDIPGNYEALQCWDKSCPDSWGGLVPAFQCKVLGGCGVMNGALMQKPSEGNFQNWPEGWRGTDLARYYQLAESMLHITDTPSNDARQYLEQAGAAFVRDALGRAGFTPAALKPVAGTMGRPYVSARDGVRQSTASVLLPKALRRPNFELRLSSEVTEILYDGKGRVTGVRVKGAAGAPETLALKSRGLVVLCAGALNTPRLLLASGLTAGGTVGKGISDHALLSLVYATSEATEAFGIRPPSSSAIAQYVESRSGPLAQFGPTLAAFLRDPSTAGGSDVFDVELWVNPHGHAGEVHVSLVLMRPTCSSADLRLTGEGRVGLSNDLYLQCERDQKTMQFAIDFVDRWLGARGARPVYRGAATAMNHFAGSCALGPCASPADLRIRGAQRLAVADASLLPGQVWAHPALTLTALALKAGDVLAQSL